MALIWHANISDQEWLAVPLESARYRLCANGLTTIDNVFTDGNRYGTVLVRRNTEEEEWILIGTPESCVRINSIRLMIGIRVLRDRDEILIKNMETKKGMKRFFFSTERLVRVEAFPAINGSSLCPRCKQLILSGDMAVQCPNPRCGVWHHQKDEGLPCWTYESTCAAQCGWPTNLNADYRWTPEEL